MNLAFSTTQERLQHTITTVETYRAALGRAVADTTLTVLKEKLASLSGTPVDHRPPQRKQVTTLFANITGFGSTAEFVHDTNLLNLKNLLWRRLDQTIQEQGGIIDKHTSDGVMGLFGVPMAREDDPERAVRAALTMRAALSDFVDELRSPEWRGANPHLQKLSLDRLQLRIGINTGPVLLGEVGKQEEYTVIGDAVNVASRLEHVAPSGAILISHETYLLVRELFNIESLGPMIIKGKSEPIQAYLVLGVKPREFYHIGRGVEGIETHMVGRDKELHQLQTFLQTAVTTRQGQIVTITGEAGVGKSRLVYEFSHWLESLPYSVTVLKARTDERASQLPYSLIRDLFSTSLGILDNDRATVVEEKLVRGVERALGPEVSDARQRALVIGQLIGLDLVGEFGRSEPPQLRDRAFVYVAELLERITTDSAATVLFFEDVHWADPGSLDLIDHLGGMYGRVPLLVICLGRPTLLEKRPSWGDTGQLVPQTHINLTSLSTDESRQLVLDILRKLPQIPPDLSDLIVSRAEGNPFYVEEMVKVLIEDGVIVPGADKWQLHRSQLTKVRIPATLTGVLQARLDRLSLMERLTLQRAAVIGRIFWDRAIIHMNQTAGEPINPADTTIALQALEKREIIFQRQASIFAGTQAYFFKHAVLHEVTYESVLLRNRPAYHKQIAEWLAEQSGERVAEYAALIAEHYELAGERMPAAELYELAATRAEDTFTPSAAIDSYGKALSLLSDELHHAAWQVRLQERLGQLLRQQGRLVEAAQIYMTMRYMAELDGDLAAQARAWNGLAATDREQNKHDGMLENASRAEQVAWLVNAEPELVTAMLFKAEAYWQLGDFKLGVVTAEKAREISERSDDMQQMVTSLRLLCRIFIAARQPKGLRHYLGKLEQALQQAETAADSIQMAYLKLVSGDLHYQLKAYDRAAHYLIDAAKLYRQGHHQSSIAEVLHLLGETAQAGGKAKTAVPLYREAISIAEAIGDRYNILFYRTHLAAAYLHLEQIKAAETELQRVLQAATDVSKIVNWRGLGEVRELMEKVKESREKLSIVNGQ